MEPSPVSFKNFGLGSPAAALEGPAISPEGTAEPTQLSDAEKEANRQLVDRYAEALYDASAEEILTWAHEHVTGKLVVTLSMENTVLAELASRYLPDSDFLFLDTGYHFPETLDVAQQVEERYPQNLVRAKPLLTVGQQDARYGINLYGTDPAACCRMRKVEPLAASMAPYTGWITGLRRADSPLRASAPSCGTSTTAATCPARTSASSPSPTGPKPISGNTSEPAHSSFPQSTSPTRAKSSTATACG